MSAAKVRGEGFWRELIARREVRQLTVAEACRGAGVSEASFYHWQQRLRDERREPQATAKRASTTSSASTSSSLLPVKIVEDRSAVITLEMPSGIRLQVPPGCDAVGLQDVLRAVLAATREPA